MTQLSIDQLVTRVLDLADRTAPLDRKSQQLDRSFDDHLSSIRPAEPPRRSVKPSHSDESRSHHAEPATVPHRDEEHEEDAETKDRTGTGELEQTQQADRTSNSRRPDKAEHHHGEKSAPSEATTQDSLVGEAKALLPQDSQELASVSDKVATVDDVSAKVGAEKAETGEVATSSDTAVHTTPDIQEIDNAEIKPNSTPDSTLKSTANIKVDTVSLSAPSVVKPEALAADDTGAALPESPKSVVPEAAEELKVAQNHEQVQPEETSPETVFAASAHADDSETAKPKDVAESVAAAALEGRPIAGAAHKSLSNPEPKKKVDRRLTESPAPRQPQPTETTDAARTQPQIAPSPTEAAPQSLDSAVATINATDSQLRTAAPHSPSPSSSSPTSVPAPLSAAGQIAQPLRPVSNGTTKPQLLITEAQRARFVQRVAGALQSAQRGDGEMRIRLHPPELGALRMQLKVEDGKLIARLETETHHARQMLLDNLPALRDRLANHDIRVEKFDVEVRHESANHAQHQSTGEQANMRQQRHAPNRSPHYQRIDEAAAIDPIVTASVVSDSQLNVVI